MKAAFIILLLSFVLSGCETMRTDGSRLTHAEWREKVRQEAEAKKRGVPFTYKSRAQLREEAKELNAIMAETINSMVKSAPVKGD